MRIGDNRSIDGAGVNMESRMEVEMHRANECYLEMLAHMAQHDAQPMFDLVSSIKHQLIGLDAVSRCRAGQRPYLLFGFHLKDAGWWLGARGVDGNTLGDACNSHFPRRAAVQVARRALTLAWHTAGARVSKESIKLGLSVRVAELISQMQLADLERIADRHIEMMRPRWEYRPLSGAGFSRQPKRETAKRCRGSICMGHSSWPAI